MKTGVSFCRFSPFSRREWNGWLVAMDRERSLSFPGNRGEVRLLLARDGEIASLNAAYLGCPGPTNILSFPDGLPGSGDLALSLDALRRESRLYGQREDDYALLLLAHGLAHLQGHGHGPEMEDLCRKMLAAARRTFLPRRADRAAGRGTEKA
jgi:probable rRNA maturation factor